MIKRIDLYLLRQFFTSLLVVTIAIGLTIVVINVVEELRDFIDHQVPLVSIVQYYMYFGGWVVKAFLPMFVLLATLFSVSMLSRKNEILAMKSSGISLYRITAPFLLVTALIAAGHFYYNEYIFPSANEKRLEIKEFTIEKKAKSAVTRVTNIYRQISPGYFYTVGTFNAERQAGSDIKVYKTRGHRLSQIITAADLVYQDHRWLGLRGMIRDFDDTAGETYHEFDTLVLKDIEEKPEDFARKIGNPEDMGVDELKGYIDLMKRTGGPFVREAVDLEFKYSYPLASVIVVLMSIPFAANPRRGGIAVSFAAGAIISLLYFVLFRMMQSAGYNEKIPKELAAWGINGAFFLIGLLMLFKARK